MTYTRLLRAASLCAVAACGSTDTVESPTAVNVAVSVPITRLRAEPGSFVSTSGLRTAQRTVISDSTAWRAAWSILWAGVPAPPSLPVVDFAREVILLAALGERGSSGYQIVVDSANSTADKGVVVHVRTVSPGATCGRYGVITAPVDVARMVRVPGPVSFREEAVVTMCP